jgi:hypothetical protein
MRLTVLIAHGATLERQAEPSTLGEENMKET